MSLQTCSTCGRWYVPVGQYYVGDIIGEICPYKGMHPEITMYLNPYCFSEEISRLKAEIDRLKAERRWIPVSERLPEDGLYWAYVYSCDEKWQQETIYKISHGGWQIEDYIKVSHWMPLPTPPEEK